MDFWKFSIVLLLMLAPALSLFAQERKVPIDIKITIDKSIPIRGNEVQVTLEVTPLVAVTSAKVTFTVSDKISLTNQQVFTLGALTENTKQTFVTRARLLTNGRALIKGGISLVTDKGYSFGASESVYFLIKKGETFYGKGDIFNAQIDSLKYRLRSGRLTPEAYKEAYKKGIKKIITGKDPSSSSNKESRSDINKQDKARLAASTFDVSGSVRWTDRNGTVHPLKKAVVEIWNEDLGLDDLLATTTTNDDGSFSAPVTGSIIDDPDIYVRVLAKSDYFYIVPEGDRGDESETYSFDSPTYDDKTAAFVVPVINIPKENEGVSYAPYNAFSIHAALIESVEYVKTREPGASLPKFSVEFPISSGTTRFSSSLNNMYVLPGDRFDWDVIHHEFGHYIASQFSIATGSPGGGHSIFVHLAETFNTVSGPRTLSKDDGFALAWSEAWATYFGTTLQAARGLDKTTFSGVGAGNELYEDTDDANLSYSLEGDAYPSLGEDNELAIQRILWDLYDTNADAKDNISLGDASIWNRLKNTNANKLSSTWPYLTNGQPLSEIIKYGDIFAEHKVASLPKEPADNTMLSTLKDDVTFKWDANGAGPSYLNNKFTVEFWTKDFSKRLFTSLEQTTPEFKATSNNLKGIFATESEVKWFIKSSNSSSSPTGPYTSPALTLKAKPEGVDFAFIVDDTGSMSEEIGGVRNGLLSFLSKFPEESGLVFQLVTFKDSESPRAPTTNLTEIKNQVASLVASGGGDCPEGSVEALTSINSSIKDGGTVMLYTDADPHPGLDFTGITSQLTVRGVKVSTIISGACTAAPSSFVVSADGKKYTNVPISDNKDESTTVSPGGDAATNANSIEAFSYIAKETGGIFAYIPEVNSGNPNDVKRYENIGFNILVGATSASVAFIEPYRGPAGSTLTTTITGVKTNFNASSSIAFEGSDISIGSVNVLSPTRIEATISIPAGSALGLKNITITTPIAGGSEVAQGTGLLEVTAAPSTPTIVSITPPSGSKGQSLTVTISGTNTHFTDASVLNLGAGVTVSSVKAISSTQLQAEILIAANASAGYRNVVVTTEAEVASENVIGPFLIIEAGCTPINIASVTIPSGGTATLTASGCAGTLLWSTGATTSTIMVGPLTESTTVSATCTTGACVVSATGSITVQPAVGGSLALLAPTYNCATGAFTFNTSGGDGSPITFFAIGITSPTTNPNQFVDTELRTAADAPPITLQATQNGVTVSYVWDIRATCPITPPPVGGSLTFLAPTYNCATGAFTFNTSGGDGSPITFFAIGITSPTTNPNQFVDTELRTAADASPITLQATQSGVTISYVWDIRAACSITPPPVGGSLTLLAPTYNCATGAFTFNTSGGDGSPIEYRAVPGITDWTANPNQFVDEGSRTANDVQPFLLQARQSGIVTTLVWDLKATCSRARLGVTEPLAGMNITVLGNPVAGQIVDVTVTGVEQQAVHFQLSDLQGQFISEKHIKQAAAVEHVQLQLNKTAGVYLLQVSSPNQIKVVRVLKVY